jgi:acetyl-CoA acetyltransferase
MSRRAKRVACITGVGESVYQRRCAIPVAGLVHAAVTAAFDDAGVTAGEIDAVFTESSVMPTLFPTDKLIAQERLAGVRQASYHSTYGPGIGQAVSAAAAAIDAEDIDTALVYFGVDFGSRPGAVYALHGVHPLKRDLEFTHGLFGQPTYFALFARRYMHVYGVGEDELRDALCAIAVRTRENALTNPAAICTEPLDPERYAAAKMIADPLCLYDCSLTSDGAAAIVLSRAERAEQPVRVLGAGYGQSLLDESSVFTQNPSYPRLPFVQASADRAFAAAGVGREDIDVAEIYDCFTISLLLQLEDMGFCTAGEGAAFVANGAIGRDSPLPVNTHGGLLSQAYVMGINHIVEAVSQLRGRAGAGQVAGATLAAVGLLASREHATLILEAPR